MRPTAAVREKFIGSSGAKLFSGNTTPCETGSSAQGVSLCLCCGLAQAYQSCPKSARLVSQFLGQSPIILSNSEPEPDFTIVKNRADDYLESHPNSENVWLVIEISDSSLTYDQETKLSLYVEHNIQNYWIFNLLENVLETYSEPYQKPQGDFGYRTKKVLLPNEAIALPHFPDLVLDLSKTFPTKLTH
jgi:Uma2 family endonuclease